MTAVHFDVLVDLVWWIAFSAWLVGSAVALVLLAIETFRKS